MHSLIESLPSHLRRYVVNQNYAKYTPEDQAVWRYIMKQLRNFLIRHAHPCYMEGLEKTGITLDRIPRIDEMNMKLQSFGWGAVPVSGFIPPAAFMEFQSLGILPIASDMRSIDHLLYTPAPDIVHEAAGHAPILINEQFAAYLKKYADVARKAIISKQDLDQYEAIRVLSDVKENPMSTAEQIARAEENLNQVSSAITEISEAGWLSRMNWWTAEYGLIGELKSPKIFGAGLLSSVGESRMCLDSKVKKIPLTVDCVNVGYDITEPQPQLFVTPDFSTLHQVLEELAHRLAFRRGGGYGLERALKAQTVNTIELETGLQISGRLTSYKEDKNQRISYLQLTGPSQISTGEKQLTGHGPEYHQHGYSTPIGLFNGLKTLPTQVADLERAGLTPGKIARLQFENGIEVHGDVTKFTLNQKGQPVLVQFKNCTVKNGEEILFKPEWGLFDMALGTTVVSVFGGPADREKFESSEDFITAHVPPRIFSEKEKAEHSLFESVQKVFNKSSVTEEEASALLEKWRSLPHVNWLIGYEIVEGIRKHQLRPSLEKDILQIIQSQPKSTQLRFQEGLELLSQRIQ